MKPPMLPATCGISLAVMLAAAASHWWSVREFLAHRAAFSRPPAWSVAATSPPPAAPLSAQPAPVTPPAPIAKNDPPSHPSPGKSQKDFYEELIDRMGQLQNQNRDLLDQIAQTNRDMMNLEFRLDTHSESFRPLKVPQDITDPAIMRDRAALDDGLGVLPPRAEPVDDLPTFE